MNKFDRRNLIKRFGLAGVMVMPVFRQTRALAATQSKKYIQIFKPLGHPGDDATYLPSGNGTSFSFSGKLTSALEPHKDELTIFRNLNVYVNGGNVHGEGISRIFTNAAAGSGPGERAVNFLPPKGPSIDHLIADHLYRIHQTPLKHIHWGYDTGGSRTIDTTSFPQANRIQLPERDVAVMYNTVMSRINAMCGSQGNTIPADVLAKRSILDANLQKIKEAKASLKVSKEEASKLDAYAEKLRILEKEIATLYQGTNGGRSCPSLAEIASSRAGQAHIRASLDLMVMAIDWDLVNVASYMFGGAQSGAIFPETPGASFHKSSHDDRAQYSQINRFLWRQVAYFLGQLKSIKSASGQNLLEDNAVLIAGGEIADGTRHSYRNIPFMVAGKAGGYFNPGRIVQANQNNRMNSHGRVLLAMCHAMGLKLSHVGERDKCPGGPIV